MTSDELRNQMMKFAPVALRTLVQIADKPGNSKSARDARRELNRRIGNFSTILSDPNASDEDKEFVRELIARVERGDFAIRS